MGCVAKELGISGDAGGGWIFGLPIARLHGIFPREDRGFKEFRGFPDMELGIFRVAKILRWGPSFSSGSVPLSDRLDGVI